MDQTARNDAITEIRRVFSNYRQARSTDQGILSVLSDGKLYELYVLSDLVKELAGRGFRLRFVGSASTSKKIAAGYSTLKFKAGPGMIKLSDSHFELSVSQSSGVSFRIFVDIEFDTLGHHHTGASDNSRRHEVDIIVTTASSGYPAHHEIALGVECKAEANFGKHIVKQALGVRRELSYFTGRNYPSTLTSAGGHVSVWVQADPPSEFRLAYIDQKGDNYADSPGAFGIEFRHLEP
ncbi:hypothetical protein U1763_19725 [Sphingomonas sp. LB2R24]|uniref:hypothetical protein n=1 Tax=Sphingomonas sorbitolis TaxID=3096165 RepID=UPI002FCAEE1B